MTGTSAGGTGAGTGGAASGTSSNAKRSSAKGHESMNEKKQELEKRLETVKGVIGGSGKKATKKGTITKGALFYSAIYYCE